jgi:hypothetical protein
VSFESLSLLVGLVTAGNTPQAVQPRQPTVLLVIDQGHLSRDSVPFMLDAVEAVLSAARGARTTAVIISGRRLVYPDATREGIEGSLSGTEGFYDHPQRFGMTEAEAREIARGNESVRDTVRQRGGGADVVVNARALIDEVQELGVATLDSLASILANGRLDDVDEDVEVVAFVTDRPVFFRPPDRKVIERLTTELRGTRRRMVVVQIDPARSVDFGGEPADGLRVLASLPNTTVVNLSSSGAGSTLSGLLQPSVPAPVRARVGRSPAVSELVDRASSRVVRFSEAASFEVARED